MEGILVKAIGGSLWAVALTAFSIMLKHIVPPLIAAWTAERAEANKRLSAREERVDKSLANRLKNLETQADALASTLGKYHKAVVILAAEVTVIAPNNPKLGEVAELLEIAWPAAIVGPMPSDFAEKLRNIP